MDELDHCPIMLTPYSLFVSDYDAENDDDEEEEEDDKSSYQRLQHRLDGRVAHAYPIETHPSFCNTHSATSPSCCNENTVVTIPGRCL